MAISNVKLGALALFFILIFAELLLRIVGIKPGWIRSYEGFSEVDSLIEYQNFTTDESGIYKFSSWVSDSMWKYFDCKSRKLVKPAVKEALYEQDYLTYIYENSCKQRTTPDYSLTWRIKEWLYEESDTNCLTGVHNRIQSKSFAPDSGWLKSFYCYYQHPFNSEGFRSIPFRNDTTKHLKVLLVGDSFVYGMDSHPFQNSFADQLLSKGYLVYAAGIPGTDPAQYAAIVKKYTSVIKPDVVVVCFYMGNDLMKFKRTASQNQPHEHFTNAGLIASNPLGRYLDANEAYRYYCQLCSFPDSRRAFFDRALAFTSIGTLVWNFLYNFDIVEHVPTNEYVKANSFTLKEMITTTKVYLDNIKRTCTENNVPLINAIIPDRNNMPSDVETLNLLFGSGFYTPNDIVVPDDFYKDKVHFNNNGSYKFASFLDSILTPYSLREKI